MTAASPHPEPLRAHGETETIAHTAVAQSAPGGAKPALAPDRGEGWGEGQQWIRICGVEDIPQLGARIVTRSNEPNIAVFRTASDRIFALTDRCPHRGGPLSQGIVFGERVACPLHNMCIELASGCAVAPDTGQVQSHAVHIENGVVFLELAKHPDARS